MRRFSKIHSRKTRLVWRFVLLGGLLAAVLIGCARPTPDETPYVPIRERTPTPTATETGRPTRTPSATTPPGTPSPEPTPTQIPYVTGEQYFVAVDGSPEGDGSMENPWDLAAALKKSRTVQPGDILWLRGGVYTMPPDTWYLIANLHGSPDEPVIVRNYPGERAIIDGAVYSRGKHTWYWGLEFTSLHPERYAKNSERTPGLNLEGTGDKAINLLIYNNGHPGIGFWEEVGDGGEIYGAIIWGNGLYDADADGWERGSGIYAQNKDGRRLIADTISFRNFSTGMKAYTENGYVNGFTFEGNIVFDNRDRNIFVSGRDHPLTGLEMISNYTYRSPTDDNPSVHIGYPDVVQQDVMLKDNYFVSGTAGEGALYLKYVASVQGSGNTLISRSAYLTYQPPSASLNISWDNNQYFGGAGTLLQVLGPRNVNGIPAGYTVDENSSFSNSMPAENAVFVRPNKYEPGRGHIVVYNWERKDEVAVDVSAVLKPGDAYVIFDAQNLFGEPVLEGVYNGELLTLPMNLTAVSEIPGELRHLQNVHTDKEFNVFVILPPSAVTW